MSAGHPAQATILLVDDTLENLNYDRLSGRNRIFRIAVARSGEEALERIAYAPADLILLDVMMPPGMDGFETCRRLKVNAAFRDSGHIHDGGVNIIDKMQEFLRLEGLIISPNPCNLKKWSPEFALISPFANSSKNFRPAMSCFRKKTNNCNKRFQSASRPKMRYI